LLGGLEQARVDDLEAGVAQGARDHLGAAVVPVEAGLGDDDAIGPLHRAPRAPTGRREPPTVRRPAWTPPAPTGTQGRCPPHPRIDGCCCSPAPSSSSRGWCSRPPSSSPPAAGRRRRSGGRCTSAFSATSATG